jgi:hypothetical protein
VSWTIAIKDSHVAFHEVLRMLREGRFRFREALVRVGLGWGDRERAKCLDRFKCNDGLRRYKIDSKEKLSLYVLLLSNFSL